jgi:RNA-splicing ligase RtcB
VIAVKGTYNTAQVYAKALETSCENKIRIYLDHPDFADTAVRIMPDTHLGKTTVIGWTATYTERVIPSILGLDIGCGVCACNLGRGKLAFDKLDGYIRKNIPGGQKTRETFPPDLEEMSLFAAQTPAETFKNGIRRLCEKHRHHPQRVFMSLGTLGGGNHFIEIDRDENHNRWLLIHTGSRIFGARTAEYYEILALRETEPESPLKHLAGETAEAYIADACFVQRYARLNRALIAQSIVRGFFKLDIRETEYRDCPHNYIDPAERMIRKGAISAKPEEPVIIPFSMSEGAVLGRGLGNREWNQSAPHGAGRKKARAEARKGLSMDEYRKEMRGVWSSVVCKDTLEESPMAYRKSRDILAFLPETVSVEQRLKPLYNFKAVD